MLRGLLVLACASIGIAGITADPYALGTPGPVPYPKTNPYSAAKAELGRRLFEERALSNTRQTPCTWCHNEPAGFSDGRTVNIGDTKEALNRHSPSLIGSGYQPQLFWDGRVKSLEEQVLMPIEHSGNVATFTFNASFKRSVPTEDVEKPLISDTLYLIFFRVIQSV